MSYGNAFTNIVFARFNLLPSFRLSIYIVPHFFLLTPLREYYSLLAGYEIVLVTVQNALLGSANKLIRRPASGVIAPINSLQDNR